MNEKHGTPGFALICSGIFSCIGPFLGTAVISTLTSMTSVALMVCWFNDTRALIRLRRTEPDLLRPYRLRGGKFIAGVGVAVCVILFIMCILPMSPAYVGNAGICVIIAWGLLGLIFYKGNSRKRNAVSAQEKYDTLFANMKKREEG